MVMKRIPVAVEFGLCTLRLNVGATFDYYDFWSHPWGFESFESVLEGRVKIIFFELKFCP